jgi:hypothetical protein
MATDRIDKAHQALADALEAWDGSPDVPHERVLILLRIADVQAQLSQAESLASIMDSAGRFYWGGSDWDGMQAL